MTCRYTNTDWTDVIYNCVRRTPGGVIDASRFLTDRRGKAIHSESLRAKLRGEDPLNVEMACLLSEWMMEKAGGSEYAHDWIVALAAERGLLVDSVPPMPVIAASELVKQLQTKVMHVGAKIGGIIGLAAEAVEDGCITQNEADPIAQDCRDARAMLHLIEQMVLRAVRRSE